MIFGVISLVILKVAQWNGILSYRLLNTNGIFHIDKICQLTAICAGTVTVSEGNVRG